MGEWSEGMGLRKVSSGKIRAVEMLVPNER